MTVLLSHNADGTIKDKILYLHVHVILCTGCICLQYMQCAYNAVGCTL